MAAQSSQTGSSHVTWWWGDRYANTPPPPVFSLYCGIIIPPALTIERGSSMADMPRQAGEKGGHE